MLIKIQVVMLDILIIMLLKVLKQIIDYVEAQPFQLFNMKFIKYSLMIASEIEECERMYKNNFVILCFTIFLRFILF